MRRSDTSAAERVNPSVLREFDGHDTQPFDVTWMADAANRNPVVNLKDLSSITPKGQKQYSIGEAKTDGGTSG